MRAVTVCFAALVAPAVIRPSLTYAALLYGRQDYLAPNAITVTRTLNEDSGIGAASVSSGAKPTVSCSRKVPEIIFKSDGRLYVEHLDGSRGGCVTLTDIYASRLAEDGSSMGPLYILDANDTILNDPGQKPTGRWILRSDLYIQSGVTLVAWGTKWGGDADVIRLDSNPSYFYNLRGYGGNLSFYHTKVTSWDLDEGMPREYYAKGRSYISCVSERLSDETCKQRAKKERGECRMDVISTEMAYLGYPSSESYGLTWKVRGLCDDLRNLDLFDDVNVYGDIIDSDIHHNYFGVYTFGHEGGVWVNNHMHDNHEYGFDPHDDSDNLVIAYNTVYRNGNHGIIASKRCNNVSIHHNEVYDGEQVGIFLHRSSDKGRVYNNYVHDNLDAGMALHESMDADIYDNVFERNAMGVRISVGGSRNLIHNNLFDTCLNWGFVTYVGSDSPWASDGHPAENVFYENTMINTEIPTRFRDSKDSQLYDNFFEDVGMFRFDDTDDTLFRHNVVPGSSCLRALHSSFTSDSDLPGNCY